MSSTNFPEEHREIKFRIDSLENALSDDEEEYISSEDLINKLQKLIDNLKEGVYTEVTRQDISDSLDEYISDGGPKPVDPDTISYLFRGWWITDALKRIQNPGLENPPPLDNCPFCLRKNEI